MSSSVADYLGILLLGGIMGVIGQGVRSVVGLKKMFDQAHTIEVGQYDLFTAARLFVSLFIGFVAGAAAAIFTVGVTPSTAISTGILTALAMAGYAGADFIEGIASRFTSFSSPSQNKTTALQENTQQLKLVAASLSAVQPPKKPTTIGDILAVLSDAYIDFSQAVDNAAEPMATLLANARDLVGWAADEITEQHLHSDAQILSKLSDQLKDPTGKLKDLKSTLQQIQAAAGVAADVLNAVATVLPIL